MELLTSDEVCL